MPSEKQKERVSFFYLNIRVQRITSVQRLFLHINCELIF